MDTANRMTALRVLLAILTILLQNTAVHAQNWEYGGYAAKTDGDDLYAFNMTIDNNYEGDLYLSDSSYQIGGPNMGQWINLWTWGSSAAPTYDDGSVRIENLRHVDQSSLSFIKYPDHIHYRFRLKAWTFHAGHLWFTISLQGSKSVGSSRGGVAYQAHVQYIGWQGVVQDGYIAGTTGRSLRLEALRLWANRGRHIYYQAHVQNIGWQNVVSDGEIAGTTGRSLRLEAIKIWVDRGHVTYYVHLAGLGWRGPYRDGEIAGTTGQSRRMEAIGVVVEDEPVPTSLTIQPDSVQGGDSSTGTLKISQPAPPGGLDVPLTCDQVAVAAPVSVHIAEAKDTANFSIASVPVSASTTAHITATYAGTSQSATLTILPPVPISLNLQPDAMQGSYSANATVRLSGLAPSGGLDIALSSDNVAALVPSSAHVEGGAGSANFTVTTIPVSVSTTAHITATYAGTSQSATLTVLPPNLTSLDIKPISKWDDQMATGTVTISSPAPPDGYKIMLFSSAPRVVTIPAFITVPAGATRASFTLPPKSVRRDITVFITAKAGNITKQATLTIWTSR